MLIPPVRASVSTFACHAPAPRSTRAHSPTVCGEAVVDRREMAVACDQQRTENLEGASSWLLVGSR